MEEIAALFDTSGRVIGQAPRSRVRAENLHHGATGIVLFNEHGQIFVHQRTWVKDVYPGRWDFTAGGVIQAGENPDESARRELAEELGIDSELNMLSESEYSDENTSYHAFRYWAATSFTPKLQAEEVLQGLWMSRDELLDKLQNNSDEFMPDSVYLFSSWVSALTDIPPGD